MWAGYGSGADRCVICGRRVTPSDVQYDLQYGMEGQHDDHAMHLQCFDAWETERDRSSCEAWESEGKL